MLLEDGGEIGFGDIIREGAVAEDNGGVTGGLEFTMPGHQRQGQGFHIGEGDGGGEAHHQGAGADRMKGVVLSRAAWQGALFDGHAEVEAKFEEQLKEDVLLAAVAFEMLDGGFEAFVKAVGIGIPFADVGGIELEDAEAEVACEEGRLLANLISHSSQAFLRHFSYGSRFENLMTEIRCTFLGLV